MIKPRQRSPTMNTAAKDSQQLEYCYSNCNSKKMLLLVHITSKQWKDCHFVFKLDYLSYSVDPPFLLRKISFVFLYRCILRKYPCCLRALFIFISPQPADSASGHINKSICSLWVSDIRNHQFVLKEQLASAVCIPSFAIHLLTGQLDYGRLEFATRPSN